MRALVDPRESTGTTIGIVSPQAEIAAASAALPIGLDPDAEVGNNLPADHPAWAKDVLSLSARFRAMLSRIKPAVIRVLTYWDHHVRSIVVGGRRMAVDASGCYRLE